MADAIPVHAPEVAKKAPKKGASAGVSPDVLAEVKAATGPEVVIAEAAFKVAGGVALDSHNAVREDY